MVGREKDKGVDKKMGGMQDSGLGFCGKEIFMPFECASMRVWGRAALLLAGLVCEPEARAREAMTNGPSNQAIVVVNKSRQRFFLMEKGKARDHLCTTGQAQGDKQVRGDLKAPEGAYFVARKQTERLGFGEYGGEAYILNYPNPVDRLRGKAGSGVWVHSRGRAITPFESRGCVVLSLKDIAEVGPELKRGALVLIGEQVEIAPRKDAVRGVEERARGWCAAWCRGGAGDGLIMSEYAASIRKIERQEKCVRVISGPVRVLERLGYVVSWFAQRTASPDGGAKTGVCHLYWKKQGDGEYRIVGMAWADQRFWALRQRGSNSMFLRSRRQTAGSFGMEDVLSSPYSFSSL